MKKFLIFLLLLAIAVGIVGYWRGWFTVSTDGKVSVQVNEDKWKKDKAAFSKSAREKSNMIKEKVAGLRIKSEGLSGDDKVRMQKELDELTKKHDRLEQQIKELDDAGSDKFETIKEDLSKNLADVEKRIDELTQKLEKAKDKK